MGSITLKDFKFGQDNRRERVASLPGTLWNAENVQISRGGDIERPKRFVPTFTLPENTFGLGAVGSQLFVFGSVSTPAGLPNGVKYQQLAAPSGGDMTEIVDVKAFGGKLYVIARYDDGNIHHFYDG